VLCLVSININIIYCDTFFSKAKTLTGYLITLQYLSLACSSVVCYTFFAEEGEVLLFYMVLLVNSWW